MNILTLDSNLEWKYTTLDFNIKHFEEKPVYGIKLESYILKKIYKMFQEINNNQLFQIIYNKEITLWRVTNLNGELLLEQAIGIKYNDYIDYDWISAYTLYAEIYNVSNSQSFEKELKYFHPSTLGSCYAKSDGYYYLDVEIPLMFEMDDLDNSDSE
jgi:hypothetical protein